MRFGAVVPVLNEWRFIDAVVGQLLKVCARVLIMRSERSLSGAPVKLTPVPPLDSRVEVVSGVWNNKNSDDEHMIRNMGAQILDDCAYVFHVDSDEIFSKSALTLLKMGCESKRPRGLACRAYTYWKTPEWHISPGDDVLIPVVTRQDVSFTRRRLFDGDAILINSRLMHHLSYIRTDTEMQEKLRLFGHASEVVPDWYEQVWKTWDNNHELGNLHPTNPESFKRAVFFPTELTRILAEYGLHNG